MRDVIRVDDSGWGFVGTSSGKSFVPFGCNYHDPLGGWPPHIWTEFEPVRTREQLVRLRDLGANIVRIHLAHPVFYREPGSLASEGAAKLQTMLELCDEVGLRVLITGLTEYEGPSGWDSRDYFVSDEIRARLCRFWGELAELLRGSEAVFGYDIYNEPSLPQRHPMLDAKWAVFAGRGDAGDGGEAAVGAEEFTHTATYQLFLEEEARLWVADQVDAIKSVDPAALVTLGANPSTLPGVPVMERGYGKARGFNASVIGPLLDFTSVHFYPVAWHFGYGRASRTVTSADGVRLAIALCEATCRLSYAGRPVVLEEFGWYGGGAPGWAGLIEALPYESEEAQARYLESLILASTSWCSGWVHWTYGDTPSSPDISQFGGLVDSGGRLKASGRSFARLAAEITSSVPARVPAAARVEATLEEIWRSTKYEAQVWRRYLAAHEHHGSAELDLRIPDKLAAGALQTSERARADG
jgi:hypothetical protein